QIWESEVAKLKRYKGREPIPVVYGQRGTTNV
ncbi:unnamed protein product, partial [marine sediment metagenome]